MEPNQTQTKDTTKIVVDGMSDFIHRVYMWMSVGLLTTAVVAFLVFNIPGIMDVLLSNTLIFYGLLIAELLAVVYLSARVAKMSTMQAQIVYFLYSVLNGITFSIIFLVYTTSSIASVFLITAGMFAVISAYGFMTKRDLTTIGNFAFMALIGVILASLVNIFMKNSGFDLFLSYVAVLIFVALTAYDTQKIKALNNTLEIGSDNEKKASIIGALRLYLDFINLFLNLLRISGRRK